MTSKTYHLAFNIGKVQLPIKTSIFSYGSASSRIDPSTAKHFCTIKSLSSQATLLGRWVATGGIRGTAPR